MMLVARPLRTNRPIVPVTGRRGGLRLRGAAAMNWRTPRRREPIASSPTTIARTVEIAPRWAINLTVLRAGNTTVSRTRRSTHYHVASTVQHVSQVVQRRGPSLDRPAAPLLQFSRRPPPSPVRRADAAPVHRSSPSAVANAGLCRIARPPEAIAAPTHRTRRPGPALVPADTPWRAMPARGAAPGRPSPMRLVPHTAALPKRLPAAAPADHVIAVSPSGRVRPSVVLSHRAAGRGAPIAHSAADVIPSAMSADSVAGPRRDFTPPPRVFASPRRDPDLPPVAPPYAPPVAAPPTPAVQLPDLDRIASEVMQRIDRHVRQERARRGL